MNHPRSAVACLLGVALLCGSTRGENDPAAIPFPPALRGLTNLCLSASGQPSPAAGKRAARWRCVNSTGTWASVSRKANRFAGYSGSRGR